MSAMNRYQRRRELAITIEVCHKCKGLNEPGKTEAAPGFGSINSPVVIVGQSLCKKCMDTKVPFTGGSGRLIDASLKIAGLDKPEIFITNVVHCHPPPKVKKLRPEWIDNCKGFLFDELEIVKPKLVIGLGDDAKVTLLKEYGDVEQLSWQPFLAPKSRVSSDRYFLFMPHPAWIIRKHNDVLKRQYVADLASALRWSFDIR